MRRGEMIRLMTDAFVRYMENNKDRDLISLMDIILKTCEEAGMQPPAILVTNEQSDYWEVE